MDENLRFISVIDTLKREGIVGSYSQIADILGTNKASISDIKFRRKNVGIDLIKRMKESYPMVSIEWLITGEGEMFRKVDEPKSMEDSSSLPNDHKTIMQQNSEIIKQNSEIIRQNAILLELVAKMVGER